MLRELWLERLTWAEVEQAQKEGFDTVLIVTGSIEQHGPHLPLSTDTTLGYAIGDRLVKKLDGALLAPVVRPGLSEHHMAFKGTLTLSKETFISLVSDYVNSLIRHGFTKIILTFSHGGNSAALTEAAHKLADQYPETEILVVDEAMDAFTESIKPYSEEAGLDAGIVGVHAGECETSLFLAYDESQVRKDRLAKGYTGEIGDKIIKLLANGLHTITENGVLGDATYADKERGEKYLDAITSYMAAHLIRVKPRK